MKVAYDYQIFGSQRFGGVSRYFFELANHMAEASGGSVHAEIISPLYVNDYLRQSKPALRVWGVNAPAIRGAGRLYQMLNQELTRWELSRRQPDILHETYYRRTSVAPPKSRTVLTVFDMIHELYSGYFSPRDPTRIEKSAAVARANHIICLSENTREDLVRLLGVPREKTSVVYLGFSLTSHKLAILPPARKPYILFVGARGGYKNFDRLLEAYASISELHRSFDLIAFGGGAFRGRERRLIRTYGLDETQIRHMGGDDAILSALYRQASLFVYPSLYEGFGIPPLEAMSFNCPVACSSTSSIPEVVGDAAFQFDPARVESIAETIHSVLANQNTRESLIRKGRSRVALFSWDKCARETLEVYQKVLR
jgi:glycosyltransferase involved in cell wall biosynthesis